MQFLSTPSARRATACVHGGRTMLIISIHALREEGDQERGGKAGCKDISIHALREEGDNSPCVAWEQGHSISIHALREEGDLPFRWSFPWPRNFYPRPPRGGRHRSPGHTPGRHLISIHALREEGDAEDGRLLQTHQHFYPRPPRGGRQQKQRQNLYFQTNYTTFCTNLEEP